MMNQLDFVNVQIRELEDLKCKLQQLMFGQNDYLEDQTASESRRIVDLKELLELIRSSQSSIKDRLLAIVEPDVTKKSKLITSYSCYEEDICRLNKSTSLSGDVESFVIVNRSDFPFKTDTNGPLKITPVSSLDGNVKENITELSRIFTAIMSAIVDQEKFLNERWNNEIQKSNSKESVLDLIKANVQQNEDFVTSTPISAESMSRDIHVWFPDNNENGSQTVATLSENIDLPQLAFVVEERNDTTVSCPDANIPGFTSSSIKKLSLDIVDSVDTNLLRSLNTDDNVSNSDGIQKITSESPRSRNGSILFKEMLAPSTEVVDEDNVKSSPVIEINTKELCIDGKTKKIPINVFDVKNSRTEESMGISTEQNKQEGELIEEWFQTTEAVAGKREYFDDDECESDLSDLPIKKHVNIVMDAVFEKEDAEEVDRFTSITEGLKSDGDLVPVKDGRRNYIVVEDSEFIECQTTTRKHVIETISDIKVREPTETEIIEKSDSIQLLVRSVNEQTKTITVETSIRNETWFVENVNINRDSNDKVANVHFSIDSNISSSDECNQKTDAVARDGETDNQKSTEKCVQVGREGAGNDYVSSFDIAVTGEDIGHGKTEDVNSMQTRVTAYLSQNDDQSTYSYYQKMVDEEFSTETLKNRGESLIDDCSQSMSVSSTNCLTDDVTILEEADKQGDSVISPKNESFIDIIENIQANMSNFNYEDNANVQSIITSEGRDASDESVIIMQTDVNEIITKRHVMNEKAKEVNIRDKVCDEEEKDYSMFILEDVNIPLDDDELKVEQEIYEEECKMLIRQIANEANTRSGDDDQSTGLSCNDNNAISTKRYHDDHNQIENLINVEIPFVSLKTSNDVKCYDEEGVIKEDETIDYFVNVEISSLQAKDDDVQKDDQKCTQGSLTEETKSETTQQTLLNQQSESSELSEITTRKSYENDDKNENMNTITGFYPNIEENDRCENIVYENVEITSDEKDYGISETCQPLENKPSDKTAGSADIRSNVDQFDIIQHDTEKNCKENVNKPQDNNKDEPYVNVDISLDSRKSDLEDDSKDYLAVSLQECVKHEENINISGESEIAVQTCELKDDEHASNDYQNDKDTSDSTEYNLEHSSKNNKTETFESVVTEPAEDVNEVSVKVDMSMHNMESEIEKENDESIRMSTKKDDENEINVSIYSDLIKDKSLESKEDEMQSDMSISQINNMTKSQDDNSQSRAASVLNTDDRLENVSEKTDEEYKELPNISLSGCDKGVIPVKASDRLDISQVSINDDGIDDHSYENIDKVRKERKILIVKKPNENVNITLYGSIESNEDQADLEKDAFTLPTLQNKTEFAHDILKRISEQDNEADSSDMCEIVVKTSEVELDKVKSDINGNGYEDVMKSEKTLDAESVTMEEIEAVLPQLRDEDIIAGGQDLQRTNLHLDYKKTGVSEPMDLLNKINDNDPVMFTKKNVNFGNVSETMKGDPSQESGMVLETIEQQQSKTVDVEDRKEMLQISSGKDIPKGKISLGDYNKISEEDDKEHIGKDKNMDIIEKITQDSDVLVIKPSATDNILSETFPKVTKVNIDLLFKAKNDDDEVNGNEFLEEEKLSENIPLENVQGLCDNEKKTAEGIQPENVTNVSDSITKEEEHNKTENIENKFEKSDTSLNADILSEVNDIFVEEVCKQFVRPSSEDEKNNKYNNVHNVKEKSKNENESSLGVLADQSDVVIDSLTKSPENIMKEYLHHHTINLEQKFYSIADDLESGMEEECTMVIKGSNPTDETGEMTDLEDTKDKVGSHTINAPTEDTHDVRVFKDNESEKIDNVDAGIEIKDKIFQDQIDVQVERSSDQFERNTDKSKENCNTTEMSNLASIIDIDISKDNNKYNVSDGLSDHVINTEIVNEGNNEINLEEKRKVLFEKSNDEDSDVNKVELGEMKIRDVKNSENLNEYKDYVLKVLEDENINEIIINEFYEKNVNAENGNSLETFTTVIEKPQGKQLYSITDRNGGVENKGNDYVSRENIEQFPVDQTEKLSNIKNNILKTQQIENKNESFGNLKATKEGGTEKHYKVFTRVTPEEQKVSEDTKMSENNSDNNEYYMKEDSSCLITVSNDSDHRVLNTNICNNNEKLDSRSSQEEFDNNIDLYDDESKVLPTAEEIIQNTNLKDVNLTNINIPDNERRLQKSEEEVMNKYSKILKTDVNLPSNSISEDDNYILKSKEEDIDFESKSLVIGDGNENDESPDVDLAYNRIIEDERSIQNFEDLDIDNESQSLVIGGGIHNVDLKNDNLSDNMIPDDKCYIQNSEKEGLVMENLNGDNFLDNKIPEDESCIQNSVKEGLVMGSEIQNVELNDDNVHDNKIPEDENCIQNSEKEDLLIGSEIQNVDLKSDNLTNNKIHEDESCIRNSGKEGLIMGSEIQNVNLNDDNLPDNKIPEDESCIRNIGKEDLVIGSEVQNVDLISDNLPDNKIPEDESCIQNSEKEDLVIGSEAQNVDVNDDNLLDNKIPEDGSCIQNSEKEGLVMGSEIQTLDLNDDNLPENKILEDDSCIQNREKEGLIMGSNIQNVDVNDDNLPENKIPEDESFVQNIEDEDIDNESRDLVICVGIQNVELKGDNLPTNKIPEDESCIQNNEGEVLDNESGILKNIHSIINQDLNNEGEVLDNESGTLKNIHGIINQDLNDGNVRLNNLFEDKQISLNITEDMIKESRISDIALLKDCKIVDKGNNLNEYIDLNETYDKRRSNILSLKSDEEHDENDDNLECKIESAKPREEWSCLENKGAYDDKANELKYIDLKTNTPCLQLKNNIPVSRDEILRIDEIYKKSEVVEYTETLNADFNTSLGDHLRAMDSREEFDSHNLEYNDEEKFVLNERNIQNKELNIIDRALQEDSKIEDKNINLSEILYVDETDDKRTIVDPICVEDYNSKSNREYNSLLPEKGVEKINAVKDNLDLHDGDIVKQERGCHNVTNEVVYPEFCSLGKVEDEPHNVKEDKNERLEEDRKESENIVYEKQSENQRSAFKQADINVDKSNPFTQAQSGDIIKRKSKKTISKRIETLTSVSSDQTIIRSRICSCWKLFIISFLLALLVIVILLPNLPLLYNCDSYYVHILRYFNPFSIQRYSPV